MAMIEEGYVAFFSDGAESVGAVTAVTPRAVVIYVENFGSFNVPITAVRAVHDAKVILEKRELSRAFLLAVQHAHDAKDPNLAG